MTQSTSLGVASNPFSDSSHTFIYYPSPKHKAVARRITRGLESQCGLLLLTGEIGIGKTTLCKHIKRHFSDTCFFVEQGNPYLTPVEQLYHFCQQFKVPLDAGVGPRDLMDALVAHLQKLNEEKRRPVIVIDESHLLTKAHFGQVQVLSNFRYNEAPLVQILLVGQLEILDKLQLEGLEALNQRIGIRCELSPLSQEDTGNYIKFKLEAVKFSDPELVVPRAVKKIWQVSGGLPRLINHICAHAYDQLLYSGEFKITPAMVDEVSSDAMYSELFSTRTKKSSLWKKRGVVLPLALVLILFVGGLFYEQIFSAVQPFWGQHVHSERADGGASGSQTPNHTASTQKVSELAPSVTLPVASSASEEEKALGKSDKQTSEGARAMGGSVAVPQKKMVASDMQHKKPEVEIGKHTQPVAIDEAGEVKESSDSFGSIRVIDTPVEDAVTPYASPVLSEGENASHSSGNPVSKQNNANLQLDAGVSTSNETEVNEYDGRPLRDGEKHPVVGKLTIDAVAWSDSRPERISVLNGEVLHVGGVVNGVALVDVREKLLVLEYNGELFTREWR